MKLRMTYLYLMTLLLTLSFCSTKKKALKEDHTAHDMNESMVHLTEHEQLVSNIKTDTVREVEIGEQSTLLGITVLNEKTTIVISSRIRGRLDNLVVRNPGQEVKVGQLLYSIYSEELLSDENSLLLAEDQHISESSKRITGDLVNASRKKLQLWGLTNKQIAELERSKKASPVINIYSTVSGTLADLLVSEGQYVDTGIPLFRLSSLNSIWVEAQAYPNEISNVQQQQASIEFEAYPNKVFVGTLVFINPVLEQNKKINLLHFAIDNREKKIRQGMMAYVHIKYNQRKSLVIPKSALLHEDGGTTVWIETASGMYEKRMIITGNDNKTNVEVLFGLDRGDKVVSSGAYLINSEFILKNGANSMGGMKM
ncbi:MAG: efflux RND transporter periplasmic adaptor subunit [Bacteroidetes bacterium]|nr:efflux RND transporter periplasmic adaptor subunit [Bacteroidota bacterium]